MAGEKGELASYFGVSMDARRQPALPRRPSAQDRGLLHHRQWYSREVTGHFARLHTSNA